MTNEQQDSTNLITEQFKKLPKVVQDAILSADVEAHMRQLAEEHKLHFDQWTILENEVMFALLGLEPAENLAENLENQVHISSEQAQAIAEDISRIVFAPIREQLEKSLAPQVSGAGSSEGAAAAEHPLATIVPAVAPVVPGTPPPPPPEGKAVRAPISESYNAGEASTARKMAAGDPYREQAV